MELVYVFMSQRHVMIESEGVVEAPLRAYKLSRK
jgi:hypothetical protein